MRGSLFWAVWHVIYIRVKRCVITVHMLEGVSLTTVRTGTDVCVNHDISKINYIDKSLYYHLLLFIRFCRSAWINASITFLIYYCLSTSHEHARKDRTIVISLFVLQLCFYFKLKPNVCSCHKLVMYMRCFVSVCIQQKQYCILK